MTQKFSNKIDITIHAPVMAVWQSLIDPAMIKQYFFGVDTIGDWQEETQLSTRENGRAKNFKGRARFYKWKMKKF